MATDIRSGSETETEEATTEATATEETKETSEETPKVEETTDSATETETKESPEETKDEESSDEESDGQVLSLADARSLRSENKNLRRREKEALARVAELEPLAEELNTLKRTAMLANIRAEFGLDEKQASFLQGETEEDLKKSANEVVEAFGIGTSRVRPPVATPLVGSAKPSGAEGSYVGSKYQPRLRTARV